MKCKLDKVINLDTITDRDVFVFKTDDIENMKHYLDDLFKIFKYKDDSRPSFVIIKDSCDLYRLKARDMNKLGWYKKNNQ